MKKLTLIMLAFVACAGMRAYGAKDATINLATFNIRMNTSSDGVNAWPNRIDKVIGLIRFHEFDIFGIQEGLPEQMKDLEKMSEYAHVGVGRDDGISKGEHSAIFYLKDRFEVLESGTFWLSDTTDKPSYGWDAKIRRICSWAKMRDLQTKKTFYYFNTHFDHIAPIARRESAKLLLSVIKEKTGGKYPVICSGDFNATPSSEPIQIMLSGLKNSKAISKTPPYTPGYTFPTFGVLVKNREGREDIDHIFVNDKIEILKYGVLTDSDGANHPSDHHPVLVKLRVL